MLNSVRKILERGQNAGKAKTGRDNGLAETPYHGIDR